MFFHQYESLGCIYREKRCECPFGFDADGTSVRVQSGSIVTDINVDADWMDFHDCLTDGTTLTVYGDITGLDCSENYANLTGMELSPNAILEEVHTY